ncbi:olfactory receptor 14J1-like [Ciconia boyciana]|uniref:olfactory receptor 14J1-like n=1 Tax=Ciconia boyciana TaxID=52775 RepID=UPI003BA01AF0
MESFKRVFVTAVNWGLVTVTEAWHTASTAELRLCQKTLMRAGTDGDGSQQVSSSGRCRPFAQRQQPSNSSSTTQFLLLAFADTRKEVQLLHFWFFLGLYLAALLGNGLIITAVACDDRLHTPMYFFLLSLSVLDLGSISTTVPKSMANSLWNTRDISYAGCVVQVFFFVFLTTAEYSLLTVMAYDRYLAICKPLHYGTLLGSRACVHMAAWRNGFLNAVLHTGRHKAFSTCLPHLAVVSLYVSTGTFAYLKPPSISSPSLDLVVAVLYAVVPPAVNLLIYSMRNQDLKDALRKLFQYILLQHQ